MPSYNSSSSTSSSSSSILPHFASSNPYPTTVQGTRKAGLNLQTYSLAKILVGIILLATLFSIPYWSSNSTSPLAVSSDGGAFSNNEAKFSSKPENPHQYVRDPLENNKGLHDVDHSLYREKQAKYDPSRSAWHFKVISDLDQQSKVDSSESAKPLFKSILMDAMLWHDVENGEFSVSWGKETTLTSPMNEGGRGMELSELVRYQNQLLTMDDRTGIVFALEGALSEDDNDKIKTVPKLITMEGNGHTTKGMKLEWATTKDGLLYLGSFGKEYTDSEGNIINRNNLWVITVDREGRKEHIDWSENYNKIKQALGVEDKGYLIHEAITWSELRREWIILPRRVSSLPYNEDFDEKMGSNKIVIFDEFFEKKPIVKSIGNVTPERGFSTFKFVPGTNDDLILAIKSAEYASTGKQESYLSLFSLSKGELYINEEEIPGAKKYEGVEFVGKIV